MVDDLLELLLEFGVGDLLSVAKGLLVSFLGLVLVAAGYFLDFSVLDELVLLVGAVVFLGGITLAGYQLLVEAVL
ncbi:MAG: hypothetical protein ABEJ66_03235 [Candidatus Nanohaloarchaea archaeon]